MSRITQAELHNLHELIWMEAAMHEKFRAYALKPAFRTLGQFPPGVFAVLSFHDHSYPAAGARV